MDEGGGGGWGGSVRGGGGGGAMVGRCCIGGHGGRVDSGSAAGAMVRALIGVNGGGNPRLRVRRGGKVVGIRRPGVEISSGRSEEICEG